MLQINYITINQPYAYMTYIYLYTSLKAFKCSHFLTEVKPGPILLGRETIKGPLSAVPHFTSTIFAVSFLPVWSSQLYIN